MTNSNFKNKRFITPEKAAIILPAIISSLVSFLIVIGFAIPRYVKSNKVNNEYKEFLRKKNDLPSLKTQYQIINKKLEKLNKEKSKIIKLVSGTSNLETFLSRLGNLSKKHEINISSITPKSSIMFVKSENGDLQNELNINPDPLLVEGIKKYIIDLNFKAKFENILSFIRDLEYQENVILFKDIKIESKEENNDNAGKNRPVSILDVSLQMTVYGKI